jgi:3-hydroxyethyl bacteriochlorophyllide a dehydrogenase
MHTAAVVISQPEHLDLRELRLPEPMGDEVVVDVEWSGISTGTEKLLWDGSMPPFPGLGYPLVPGYEAVGRITHTADDRPELLGRRVFVPGARCFGEIRGLFGGSASRLVVPAARVLPVAERLGAQAVLLALAATAFHVTGGDPAAQPDLIVGHGVLGRLLARIAIAVGAPPPTVWEIAGERMHGARGYEVVNPADDARRDYRRVCEASGAATLLDTLIGRLERGGEIVLAGFYADRLAFAYPAAFMRELRLRISAEWQPDDLAGVNALIERGALNLDALVTHQVAAHDAAAAYRTAFGDAHCLKMILDWRERS